MKSKKLMATLLALTVLTSSALVGCGGGDKKDNNKDSAKKEDKNSKDEKEPERDKEQYYNGVAGEPTGLDPAKAGTNTSWSPQGMIYEGLTRYTAQADGTGKVEPGVAKEWKVSKDGLKYTFKLRDNSKWSDGQKVTAKDFEYSWKRIVDPEVGSQNAAVFNGIIKNARDIVNKKKKVDELGVKAIDDNTFEVELEKPCGYFMELTYFPVLKPVRKDYIQKYGNKYGTEANNYIGNGAYVLKEWTHKNKLVFEINENYWDKENRPIKKQTWKMFADDNAKMQAFQNGELDGVYTEDAEWIEKLKKDDTCRYLDSVTPNIDYFLLNCKGNKYLKNKKIRQALALSFDREKYCNDIVNGTAVPLYGIIPPGISVDGKPYDSFGKHDYLKDLQKEVKEPKKLFLEGLKEIGEPEDISKVKLRFYTRGTREQDKQEGEFFQQSFKENLGLNLDVLTMDYNIMYDKVEAGDFDIASGGWFADWDDPSSFLNNHHSKEGYYKYTGWVSEEYDKLIDKAKASQDTKEKAECYEKAEKILSADEVGIIPLFVAKRSTFRRKYVKNSYPCNFGFGDSKGIYTAGRDKK